MLVSQWPDILYIALYFVSLPYISLYVSKLALYALDLPQFDLIYRLSLRKPHKTTQRPWPLGVGTRPNATSYFVMA